MEFRWHDLLPVRDYIDTLTAPIDRGYTLTFGSGATKVQGRPIKTGYTDFSTRMCWVNAEAILGSETEQIIATAFLAAHERLHARCTDFHAKDFECPGPGKRPVFDLRLHHCWNILEDERNERIGGREFPALHGVFREGSRLFLQLVEMPDDSDDPGQVLQWILRRRIARRARIEEPCPLSPANLALLAQCEPICDEAFAMTSSRDVVGCARRILEILQVDDGAIGTGDGSDSGLIGVRGAGDAVDATSATAEEAELYGDETASEQLHDAIQRLLEGTGYSSEIRQRGAVTPAPYEDLLDSVRPLVAEVQHLFLMPPQRSVDEFVPAGGRLSLRAARETPQTPFRVPSPPVRRGTVAVSLVLDDSGSMTGRREYEAKRVALLYREALAAPHEVRVVLTPSHRVVASPAQQEMSRALIAGYDSDQGTAFAHVLVAEIGHLRASRCTTRYLILVTDGATDAGDVARCLTALRGAMHHGIHVFGVGLALPSEGVAIMERMFGKQHLSVATADELPGPMRDLLRRIGRTARAAG